YAHVSAEPFASAAGPRSRSFGAALPREPEFSRTDFTRSAHRGPYGHPAEPDGHEHRGVVHRERARLGRALFFFAHLLLTERFEVDHGRGVAVGHRCPPAVRERSLKHPF